MTEVATKRYPFEENGARIRAARQQAKKSQERLAAEVGTTRRHMIRLENGEHLPGGELRDRIAEGTGLSPDSLQSADDEEDALSGPSLAGELQRLAQLAAVLERRPDLIGELLGAEGRT